MEDNHLPVAKILIERGADTDGKDDAGRTALAFATVDGRTGKKLESMCATKPG